MTNTRKPGPVFEFPLCLSRACLGKMIVFICKWLKMPCFAGLAVIGPAAVRKTHLLRHLYAKNDQVAKTGSGQT